MKARDFIEYMKDKKISASPIIREGDKHSNAWYKGKIDTYKLESGRSSLTEYFKKKIIIFLLLIQKVIYIPRLIGVIATHMQ